MVKNKEKHKQNVWKSSRISVETRIITEHSVSRDIKYKTNKELIRTCAGCHFVSHSLDN